jgi:hypothetical protein
MLKYNQSSGKHFPLLRLSFDNMYFEIWQPVFQRHPLLQLKGVSNNCTLKRRVAVAPETLLSTDKLSKPK